MATASPLPARRTPEEWRKWEEQQPERYEYLGDEPVLMAGGTDRHNAIAINIIAALRGQLRGTPCRLRGADLKVSVPSGRWTYPDVFVSCGPISPRDTAVKNPTVLFEVLSPSTANYDLDAKRLAYYEIASLRHLVYVAQDRATVELVSRSEDGSWRSVIYTAPDHVVELAAIDARLSLADIYEDVSFEAEAETTPDAAQG
jgi:Uma2 family endonuclease